MELGKRKERSAAADFNEFTDSWALRPREKGWVSSVSAGWPAVSRSASSRRGKKRSTEVSGLLWHPVPGRHAVQPCKGSYCYVCPTNPPCSLGSERFWWKGDRWLQINQDTSTAPASRFLPSQQLLFFFLTLKINKTWDFPGGAVVENLPANAGDMGSSPGLGRSHMPWSN